MELAGEYAYAGRDVVVAKVLEILGAEAVHEVHNHHNFAWREEHFGRTYWVVRKGCTPARPGPGGLRRRLDGRRVGDPRGRREPGRRRASLYSTVHGAGRVMSRTQGGRPRAPPQAVGVHATATATASSTSTASARRRRAEEGRLPRPPGLARAEGLGRGAGLAAASSTGRRCRRGCASRASCCVGGGADEAPEVYKRLPEVLAAHGDSIRVKHTLRPLGVAMAGRDVVDPYKD